MRSISGFDRPIIQWLFVGLSVVLLAAAAGAMRAGLRATAAADAARAAYEAARVERERLDSQLARERAMREALALELARERERAGAARAAPTLTLTPMTTRGALPPEATAPAQHDAQVIELRLVLPRGTRHARYDVVVRDWHTGGPVWSRAGLTSAVVDGRRMVTALITGDVLRPGAYELLLTGTTDGKSEQAASYDVALK